MNGIYLSYKGVFWKKLSGKGASSGVKQIWKDRDARLWRRVPEEERYL